MPRLPDRFDLWIRRARESADPARQIDYVLGALFALPAWHFVNIGTRDEPVPAASEMDGGRVLLVFSDADRAMELAGQLGAPRPGAEPSVISIATAQAWRWATENGLEKCADLLINPGEDAALVPMEQVRAFAREWQARGVRQAAGFWIPNLTSEEEDFWQEHGL